MKSKNNKTTGGMTHAQYQKEMKKIVFDRTNKKRKISVNIKGKMTVDKFAEKIKEIIYVNEDIDIDCCWFIALLESKFENLDTVIILANHFNYIINENKKEDPEWDWKKYTPKVNVPKDLLNLGKI